MKGLSAHSQSKRKTACSRDSTDLDVWNSFINHLAKWKREESCNICRLYQHGRGLQTLRRRNLRDWKRDLEGFMCVLTCWRKVSGKNRTQLLSKERTPSWGIINCIHIRKRALLAKQKLNRRHWSPNWMWVKKLTLWKVSHILEYMAEVL